MSEDLQHIDDVFRDAIGPHTGSRSASVWEKLEAQLDKEEVTVYKRRYIVARRVAITLFLLLFCLFIYDTNIKKTLLQRSAIESIKLPKADKIVNPATKKTRNFSGPEKSFISKNASVIESDKLDNLNGTAKVNDKIIAQTNNLVDKNKNGLLINNRNKPQINNYNSQKASLMSDSDWPQASVNNEVNNNLNAPREGHSKSNDANVFVKWNREEKLKDTENRYLNPRSMLSAVLQYNLKINTDLLIISENNISKTTLKLSDSLNQVIAHAKQHRNKMNNSFNPYWSITGIASPEWTQDNLANDLLDNNSANQDEVSQIEHRENHKPSFSAGLLASYQFKKAWAVQTGLIYSKTAIAIDPQEIFAGKQLNGQIAYKYNTSSGYGYIIPGFGLPPAVGDSLITTIAQHNLQYLSVPVILKYRFEKKRFYVSPGVGITGNFLTRAKIQTQVVDAMNTETVIISKLEGAKPFYLGLMATADIQYKLNSKWSLNCMPSFRYAATPVTKNNVVKTYPYSFGIGFGISYRL